MKAGGASQGIRAWAVALFLLTLAAYLPALQAGYVWDDDDYLTANPTLQDLSGLRRIWLEPGATPQYYPLVFTTFWIERRLWGLQPFGFHLVNVLLHAGSAVLLWRVLKRLRIPGAWFAAAVFALHPVHVESVAWITERKNVLSGLFYLAAARAYLRFEPADGSARASVRPRGRYALALLFFTAALFSKTVTSTLPAALALVLWWKRGRLLGRDLVPLLPMLVLGILLGWNTASLERAHVGAKGAEFDLSFIDRILIAGRAVWFYLGKLVWPSRLSFVYPRWQIDAGSWWPFVFPLALAMSVAALWFLRRRLGRGPLVAALFFCGTLFPALGFVNTYPMLFSFVADHFQYLASIGPIGLGVAAVGRLWPDRPSRSAPARFFLLRGREAGAVIVLLVLGLLTFRQSQAFRNEESLWLDALRANPSWLASHNLGALYVREGKLDLAIRYYKQAAELRPDKEATLYDLAGVAARAGRLEDAGHWYGEALRVRPDRGESHNQLGNVLFQLGRKEEALLHLQRAVQLLPDYASARRNLAYALADAGRTEEALVQLRRAVELEPNDGMSMNRISLLLLYGQDATPRDRAEAVDWAERAVRTSGSASLPYMSTLAAAYAESGRLDDAIACLERAIGLAEAAGNREAAEQFRRQRDVFGAGAASEGDRSAGP